MIERCEQKTQGLHARIEQLTRQRDKARQQRDHHRSRSAGEETRGDLPSDAEAVRRERDELRALNLNLLEDLEETETHPVPADLPYPLPPSDLRWRIGGKRSARSYLEIGANLGQDLVELCQSAGRDPTEFTSILDFGCGCGRVLRQLPERFPRARIHGADVDAEAVAWCEDSLPFLAGAHPLPDHPPSKLAAEHFDLIFAISVFTHLPLSVERAWLSELRRLSKPGALIILSFLPQQDADLDFTPEMALENDGGFQYFRTMEIPELPDYYHGSYHTDEAMRKIAGDYFEVLSLVPRAANRHQNVVICQAPEGEPPSAP